MKISFYDELWKIRNNKINSNTLEWENNLLSILTAMFDWKVPQISHTEFIEIYLNMLGECAIWETSAGYAVTRCVRAGTPTVNGLGSDLICTTDNGESKTFNNFEDSAEVVYIKNDDFAFPDLNYCRVADHLGETERSLRKLVINSRYTPVALAHNDIEKTAIEGIYNANESDKVNVIVSSNIASEIIEGKPADIPVLTLNDVEMADKLQFLHKSKDDTLRQFYNLYGMETCGSSKMAQQSVDEVNSGCNSHLIIPNKRLEVRRKAIEELKTKFGWEGVSVGFSKCWQREELEHAPEEQPAEIEKEVIENEESL